MAAFREGVDDILGEAGTITNINLENNKQSRLTPDTVF